MQRTRWHGIRVALGWSQPAPGEPVPGTDLRSVAAIAVGAALAAIGSAAILVVLLAGLRGVAGSSPAPLGEGARFAALSFPLVFGEFLWDRRRARRRAAASTGS